MSMFFHVGCGSLVYASISDAFVVISENLVLSPRKVSFPGVVMIQENEDGLKIKFICTGCGKPIPVAEVRVVCGYCGDTLRLAEAYKMPNHSGIYCDKHMKALQAQGLSGNPFTLINSLKNYLKE